MHEEFTSRRSDTRGGLVRGSLNQGNLNVHIVRDPGRSSGRSNLFERRCAIVTRNLAPWFIVGAFLLSGCSGDEAPGGTPSGVVPSVEAARASHGTLPLTERLSGAVRARNQIEIYPQISAVITEVLVENGEQVQEGQPLVRLRDTEFRERLKQAEASHQIAVAQLRRAQAQAREARSALERARSLQEKGLGSAAELDTAEAGAESAEADVELAQARVQQSLASAEEQAENLTQTVVRAPITGVVGNRSAEIGMLTSPSERLSTIGQLDSIRVNIILTDRMLAYIEEGQRAEVLAGGRMISAPIVRISPFLHPVSHTTEAEIDLLNPDRAFRPGMFVTVDVFYGESEEATLVPLSALYENPVTGMTGVYATEQSFDAAPVDEQGVPTSISLSEPTPFRFIPVNVIAQGRMEAAVTDLESGTWVVTMGQNLLGGEAPSARVRPVPWERVRRLQSLQREDLMQDLIQTRSTR